VKKKIEKTSTIISIKIILVYAMFYL
jgi:hypothetical protein